MTKRSTIKTLLTALMLGLSLGAHAQDKPVIKLLVGFPPGGASDNLARILADKLREQLKQQVIVENRPGVGGRLAAQAVKASGPAGNTYMVAPNATFVFQHLTYTVKELGYDMNTDFTSVAQLTSYPMAMVVSTSLGVKNAKEYAAWLKANPDKGNFGTAGAGGDTHFNGLQFAKIAGTPMQVVPYRGNGPLVTDLLGGQVPAGIMTAGDVLPHQKSGKVRVVGVFGAQRSPLLPEVPTFKEQGFTIDTGDAWTGMWAPANAPKDKLDQMQNALKYALALPEVRETLIHKATLNPDFRPAEEMDRLQRSELAYWGPVIKATGFTPEQ